MESTICWFFGAQWSCVPASVWSAWASWAQTFAATAGIGIAIWVPWRQRRHQLADQAKERAESITSMAQALAGPVADMRASAMLLRKKLVRNATHEEIAKVPTHLFKPSGEFAQFRSQIHLLGSETSRQINLILAACLSLQNFIDEVRRVNRCDATSRFLAKDNVDMILDRGNAALDSLCELAGFARSPIPGEEGAPPLPDEALAAAQDSDPSGDNADDSSGSSISENRSVGPDGNGS